MKYIHTIKGSLIRVGVSDFAPSEFLTNEVKKFEYQGFFKFLKFAFLKSSMMFSVLAAWAAFNTFIAHNAFTLQGIAAGLLAALLISRLKANTTTAQKIIQMGMALVFLAFLIVFNWLYWLDDGSKITALGVQLVWIFIFSYVAYFVKFFRAYKAQKLLTDKYGNCYIAVQ